jgi:hypothetical protein
MVEVALVHQEMQLLELQILVVEEEVVVAMLQTLHLVLVVLV